MTKKLAQKGNKKNIREPEVRRSIRERKQPKDEIYWKGLPNQFNWFGSEISEEQTISKRKRKTKYEDNEDYQAAYRSSKKKNLKTNTIQALLDWRYSIQQQQLKIITDDITDNSAQLPHLSKELFSKNIVNQKLEDIAQNVEALFINIEWGKKGQSINDFQKLRIDSTKFMSKGIAFIWAPKYLVTEILDIMNKKNFFYVENLEVINFDREKVIREYCPTLRKSIQGTKEKSVTSSEEISGPQFNVKDLIKHLDGVDPNDVIMEKSSVYFNSSKKTLLMFRKNSNEKLELRHQRTCDVVFDMPANPNGKCETQLKRYIYSMIETLLPEVLIIQYKNKTELGFKMVELWAQKGAQRRGWITVVQH